MSAHKATPHRPRHRRPPPRRAARITAATSAAALAVVLDGGTLSSDPPPAHATVRPASYPAHGLAPQREPAATSRSSARPTRTAVPDLSRRQRAVAVARRYLGVPYLWGGTTPRGFDCSGLVQYVYRKVGARLPRTSWEQARAGRRVPIAQMLPGDLVAWPGHVALYVGHGQVLEAPSRGVPVRIRSLTRDRWDARAVGVHLTL